MKRIIIFLVLILSSFGVLSKPKKYKAPWTLNGVIYIDGLDSAANKIQKKTGLKIGTHAELVVFNKEDFLDELRLLPKIVNNIQAIDTSLEDYLMTKRNGFKVMVGNYENGLKQGVFELRQYYFTAKSLNSEYERQFADYYGKRSFDCKFVLLAKIYFKNGKPQGKLQCLMLGFLEPFKLNSYTKDKSNNQRYAIQRALDEMNADRQLKNTLEESTRYEGYKVFNSNALYFQKLNYHLNEYTFHEILNSVFFIEYNVGEDGLLNGNGTIYFGMQHNLDSLGKLGLFSSKREYIRYLDGSIYEMLLFPVESTAERVLIQKKNHLEYNVLAITNLPICFYSFYFDNFRYQKVNLGFGGVSIQQNSGGVESYTLVDLNSLYQYYASHFGPTPNINSLYKLYHGKDTSFLKAEYTFKNGLRQEQAFIYNMNNNKEIEYRLNYLNDRLHGNCEVYYLNGKLAFSVNYLNGMPVEITSFWDSECCNPFVSKYSHNMYTIVGGDLIPTDVGYFSVKSRDDIQSFIDQGYELQFPKGYFKHVTIKYRVDSVLSTRYPGKYFKTSVAQGQIIYYAGDKVVYKIDEVENGTVTDYAFFDKNGRIIRSRKTDAKELEDLWNTINDVVDSENAKQINCNYCSKVVKQGTSYVIEEVPCTDKSGKRATLVGGGRQYFCSVKCQQEYICNKCAIDGYSPCR